MLPRHETRVDKTDIWGRLSAPLPAGVISWRQDGKAVQRDGRYLARFVAYIEANTVRERLDSIVSGEWDLTLELLPPVSGEEGEPLCFFKARLQILGVIREDVGSGRDYKAASTDAFKRVAVRFGIGHELYAYEQNWVQVDSDSKYAKPLQDPGEAYARRQARAGNGAGNGAKGGGAQAPASQNGSSGERSSAPAPQAQVPAQRQREAGDVIPDGTGDPKVEGEPSCPKCGSRMWDNRISKRNPKAPDYKCRSRSCDGVVWPSKEGSSAPAPQPAARQQSQDDFPGLDDEPPPPDDDDLPF